MRTIKFRGKRIDGKGWIEGHYTTKHALIKDMHYINRFGMGYCRVYPESVSQFTGLQSSDGGCGLPVKDCYFGDIIEFFDTDGGKHVAEVKWNNELMGVQIGDTMYLRFYESGYFQPSKLEFQIIGNVIDNPELLK
jgi:hypothetical protein